MAAVGYEMNDLRSIKQLLGTLLRIGKGQELLKIGNELIFGYVRLTLGLDKKTRGSANLAQRQVG